MKNENEIRRLRIYYNKRGKRFNLPVRQKKIYNLLFIVGLVTLTFNIIIFAIQIKNDNYANLKIDIPFVVLINLALFCYLVYLKISALSPPLKKKERDNWFYKFGLLSRFSKTIIAFIVTFISFYILVYFNLNKGFSSIFLFSGSLGYFLYNLLIVYTILYDQKLLLSGFYTGIGTGFRILGIFLILIGIRGILVLHIIDSFFLQIFTLLIMGVIARIIVEFDFVYLKNSEYGLNYIQMRVLDVAKPNKVIDVLRTTLKKITDKEEALRLLKKYQKKGNYGVMIELVNIVSKEKTSKSKWLLGILFATIIFVLSSISEGLIQDFFNDDIKSYLCTYIKLFC